MKKIFLLLAMAGGALFTGCTIDDEADVIENNYVFEAEAFEISNVDFVANANGNYAEVLYDFGDSPLIESDVVLVYRLSDASTNTTDVWELIPRTIYLEGTDELDYDFNFTRNDLLLYMDATFALADAPAYTQNQVFRVVIIPAFDNSARMNVTDYKSVIERYNIDDSNLKTLSVK